MVGICACGAREDEDSNAQNRASHRVEFKNIATQSFRRGADGAETLLLDRDGDTAEIGRCHGVRGGEGRRIFRRRFRAARMMASARHGGWNQRNGDEGKLRSDTRTARMIMPGAGLGICARHLRNLQKGRSGPRHAPVCEGEQKKHGNEAGVHGAN